MANEMSIDESMELCLRDFESAVQTVLLSPRDIFIEFGEHLGVSWELRQELLAGAPLMMWDKMSHSQKMDIDKILDAAKALSKRAVAGDGLSDLSDPSWETLRGVAKEYGMFRRGV